MLNKIKQKIGAFLGSDKDVPAVTGLIAGLYPFLFYYSNNYPAVDSSGHFIMFIFFSIVVPIAVTLTGYSIFSLLPKLRPYRSHLLFVLLITITSSLLITAVTLVFKKKLLVLICVLAGLVSFKLYKYYKHLLLIICAMMVLPLLKFGVSFYEDKRGTDWGNLSEKDKISDAKFTKTPNIYMIQPDGYAGREIIETDPYRYKNAFYGWLEDNSFSVYKNFRSNYPASLTSNASMFAMKHHYFNDVMLPSIDMPNARNVIMSNSALRILKKNGYATFFIAQDEYFQQDRSRSDYDFYNIEPKDVPYFTFGHDVVRNVDEGLDNAINAKMDKPKFIFVEKLLPHHIHFKEGKDNIEEQRKEYLGKIEKANVWLKNTISKINENDKNALIILLSDHGGWVGMNSAKEFYSTQDPKLIRSTFGNMAAIQWNGLNHTPYDGKLKSSVNVFRVLFACLSENKSYLDYLEKDESYNIRPGNFITESVHKLIDQNGTIVNEKH